MGDAPTATVYTPDDLLTMPDGDRYELVDGRLKEVNMGLESSWVGGELHARLSAHSQPQRLGWVFPADAGFQCFPGRPNLVRKPDVSFVRRGRFAGEHLPEGHARIAPDLAVEVVSPNDLAEETMEKVRDYRSASVRLVWVIYPGCRVALVFRADGSSSLLTEDQELSGEDVVPGFTCRVRDVLPPPAAG